MSVQKWSHGENEDFPIVCDSCLGPNAYMRMLKERLGKECKVCKRPFQVFKWCPQEGRRWRETEICQTCAKIKNACQTCVLDLDFKINTYERDNVLGVHDSIPMTDINSQLYVQKMEKEMAGTSVVNHGKAESAVKLALKKIVSKQAEPFQTRSKSMNCAFYVKGNCKRGTECPFEHVMPTRKSKPKRQAPESSADIQLQYSSVIFPLLHIGNNGKQNIQGSHSLKNVKIPRDRSLLAKLTALEWQSRLMDFKTQKQPMPCMSICVRAIDTLIDKPDEQSKVIEKLTSYINTDSILYRQDYPSSFVDMQKSQWDPIVSWANSHYGINLKTTDGILPIKQDSEVIKKLVEPLKSFDPFTLAAFEKSCMRAKSFLISLALFNDKITVEQAVSASRLELEHQIIRWGEVEDSHDLDREEATMQLAASRCAIHRDDPADQIESVFSSDESENVSSFSNSEST